MEPMYIEILDTDKVYFTMYYISPYTKSYVIFDNATKKIIRLRNTTKERFFVSLYTTDDTVVHYIDAVTFEKPRQFVKGVVRNVLYYPYTVYNVELPRDDTNDNDVNDSIPIL